VSYTKFGKIYGCYLFLKDQKKKKDFPNQPRMYILTKNR